MRPIDRVLETILYVDDLDAAERFYGDILGLELDSRKDDLFVFFKCGAGMLLLFEPRAASTGRNVPAHGAQGPGHACFAIAEADLARSTSAIQPATAWSWPPRRSGACPTSKTGEPLCVRPWLGPGAPTG
jgi:catechol 2,3-dioxygenase-like lactoylglutathione lyase family enzyme